MQASIPIPKKAKEYIELHEVALVIRDANDRLLMRRCAENERWAGLWDFPRFDVTGFKNHAKLCERLCSQFLDRFGQKILIGNPLHQLKHAVTKYRITLRSFEAELEGNPKKNWPKDADAIWADKTQMSKLALSASGKKLAKWLEQGNE
jgi:A/G-specific adenine glycosylase